MRNDVNNNITNYRLVFGSIGANGGSNAHHAPALPAPDKAGAFEP